MQQSCQTETADKEYCMEQPQTQALQIGALKGRKSEKGQKQICSLEFVLTLERLPELNGTEGSNKIRKFFKKFSSATEEWPESRRISALESKISGKAERAFAAAMKHRPNDFNELCCGIEEILSEWDCTELRAFNELWDGVKRRAEEALDGFAEQLYGIVDRAYPGLPPSFVSDFAIKHLIRGVGNPEISVGLEITRRPGMSFDSFVALAVRAEAVQKATKSAESGSEHRPDFKQKTTFQPRNFIMSRTKSIVCYNCNKAGHISRNCRIPFGPKHFDCSQKSPQHQNNVKKGADFRKNSEGEKKPNDLKFSNQPPAQRTDVEARPNRKASNRQHNASSSSCSVKAAKIKENSPEIPIWFLNLIIAALVAFAGSLSKQKSKCGRIWKSKSPTIGSEDVKGRKTDGKLGTIFLPKAGEELADVAAANLDNLLKIGKSPNFPIDDRKCAQEAATDGILRPEKRADSRFVRGFYRSDSATRLRAEPIHC